MQKNIRTARRLLLAGLLSAFSLLALPAQVAAADAPSLTLGFSRAPVTAKQVVLQAINDARASLYIAAYQYTDPDILRAVVEAKKRDVDVHVLLDRTQANGDSQAVMVASGIHCLIDKRFRIMHHKVSVIDGHSFVTGSFNYSRSADKANAENALYVRHAPDLARDYIAQWEEIARTAVPCKGGGE